MKTKSELVREGPFSGRMDLWAEHELYFHGLHEQMIGAIISTLGQPLFDLGYTIGRETSLQLVKQIIPDAYIRDAQPSHMVSSIDYQAAAAEVLAEPGVILNDDPELTAIAIYRRDPHQLVTMIELISPANKDSDALINAYIKRREVLFVDQAVNIVEIDLTRSYKRLLKHPLIHEAPYNVSLFLVGQGIRVVLMELRDAFKRIAIPLIQHVLPLDLSDIYQQAYKQLWLANLMHTEGFYTPDHLPYPSLLTQAEQEEALQAVRIWQKEIEHIPESSDRLDK